MQTFLAFLLVAVFLTILNYANLIRCTDSFEFVQTKLGGEHWAIRKVTILGITIFQHRRQVA